MNASTKFAEPIVSGPSLDPILTRIRGEFLEMPGLRLTLPEACRLWGLDAPTCECVLSALIEGMFLFRTRNGAYMRMDASSGPAAPHYRQVQDG